MALAAPVSWSSEEPGSRALALQDHRLLQEPTSAAIPVILRQQHACISFMRALTSLLQPEPDFSTWSQTEAAACLDSEMIGMHKDSNAQTSAAGHLALLAQSEGLSVPSDHVENLEMLVHHARAAIASVLASCRAPASQLQAQLQERDQLIQKSQMQVRLCLVAA